MAVDYFAAQLACASCGANSEVHLETSAGAGEMALLRRGDSVESSELVDYVVLVEGAEEARLLHVWGCGDCGHRDNLACVVLVGDVINDIAVVSSVERARATAVYEEDARQLVGRALEVDSGSLTHEQLRQYLTAQPVG